MNLLNIKKNLNEVNLIGDWANLNQVKLQKFVQIQGMTPNLFQKDIKHPAVVELSPSQICSFYLMNKKNIKPNLSLRNLFFQYNELNYHHLCHNVFHIILRTLRIFFVFSYLFIFINGFPPYINYTLNNMYCQVILLMYMLKTVNLVNEKT